MEMKVERKICVFVVLGMLVMLSVNPTVSADDKGEKILETKALLEKKQSIERLLGEHNKSKKFTIKIEAHSPYNPVNVTLKRWEGNKKVPVDKKVSVLNKTYSLTLSPGHYLLYIEEVGNYSGKRPSERGAVPYIDVWAKDAGTGGGDDDDFTPGFQASIFLSAAGISILLATAKKRREEQQR